VPSTTESNAQQPAIAACRQERVAPSHARH